MGFDCGRLERAIRQARARSVWHYVNSGLHSAEACKAAGAALIQKDASDWVDQDMKRPQGEPDRFYVQIKPRCIPGPAVK
jgi:hypothetical protein